MEVATSVYFVRPVSYRPRRSRTPCAATITTSWCSALPSRKTRRPLRSASVGEVADAQPGGDPENKWAT
jgi:hypothetical protein